jgi:predicted dehydrogenase
MRRLAVVGHGARAGGVAAAIEAGAGMVLAGGDAAEAVVAAGDAAAESLALAREVLAAGKPTLCLGLPGDLATLEALAELAARRGAAIGFPNGLRYLPALVALRETLRRGEAGTLLSAFLAWRVTGAGTRDSGWGDPLATLGPAALDLLGWLVPGTIEQGQVTAAPLFGPERDTALLLLRDGAGLVRTVELVTGLSPNLEFGEELLVEVLGEDAALRAEPFNQAITVATGTSRQRREWGAAAIGPLLAEFVAALDVGTPLPGAPDTLRPTLALLESLRSVA